MNLTIDKLLAVMDRFPAIEPDPFSIGRFAGMDIIQIPDRIEPVIRLRDDCPCSDQFRRQFNAWLLETFGSRDVSSIPKGMCYMFGSKAVMRTSDAVVMRGLCT